MGCAIPSDLYGSCIPRPGRRVFICSFSVLGTVYSQVRWTQACVAPSTSALPQAAPPSHQRADYVQQWPVQHVVPCAVQSHDASRAKQEFSGRKGVGPSRRGQPPPSALHLGCRSIITSSVTPLRAPHPLPFCPLTWADESPGSLAHSGPIGISVTTSHPCDWGAAHISSPSTWSPPEGRMGLPETESQSSADPQTLTP